jgi:hypothetical protein
MTDQINNIISNIDLFNNLYSEDILKNNINNLSTYDIVRTQKNLSKEFINQYILNTDYNDDEVTIETLYNYQPNYFTK